MQYRRFGRTGWNVSEIGYGMWGMAGWTGSEDRESLASLQRAVDLGLSSSRCPSCLHPVKVILYLGSWLSVYMNLELALRALSNERRLKILEWLRSPRRHFPPQMDGDLIQDGVCGLLIARKLRVTQPTASEHLKILQQAGLIRGKRIKQWTFYKRDETQIKSMKKQFQAKV